MSWFTSKFWSNKSTNGSPAAPEPTTEKRLLEEAAPKPLQSPTTPHPSTPSPATATAPEASSIPHATTAPERRNRNPLLFTGGAVFFAFSLIITRRALARRRMSSMPGYYTNTHSHIEAESKTYLGQKEALEALNLATINVLSLAMMATGGTLWYLDINSREDLRRRIRGSMVIKDEGGEGDREVEEWLEKNFGRKEDKKGEEGEKKEGKS